MRTVANFAAWFVGVAFCIWSFWGFAMVWGGIGFFGSIMTFPMSTLAWVFFGPYAMNSWALVVIHTFWITLTLALAFIGADDPS